MSETPQGTAPVVVLEAVHKSYGARHAVSGVSLEVRHGEFFGLIGPNGAGKTTLIEIMEGLRQTDSGTVTLLGEHPWPRNRALLPRIGVQTQSSAFFSRLTAREHLRTVAALYRLDADAAESTLALVDLSEQGDTRVEALSGGQRQRLAIAAALVHEPELIFLDEPTAALDPQARRSLWRVLRTLKSQGRTIVYTTHHLDEAEALCDRVAIVQAGRIVALDSPDRLLDALGAPTRLVIPADRITVETAESLGGVDRATLEGMSVVIETRTAGQVLAQVDAAVGLEKVQTRTATLEDVYLALIGSEHNP